MAGLSLEGFIMNTTKNAWMMRALTLALIILGLGQQVESQNAPHRPKLAILRLKSSQETSEHKVIVNDLASNLASALRENSALDVVEDGAVKEVLEENSLRPDGLLGVKDYLEAGKSLKADFVVVGSAMLEASSWHACARLMSVESGAPVTTAEVTYPQNETKSLFGVLASRIGQAALYQTAADTLPANFTWNREFLLAYGARRLDLEPPQLLAQNAWPPFEISIVADVTVARNVTAVASLEFFVDDKSLGMVHGNLTAPKPVKDRTWEIGGRKYQFGLDLKEMRVFMSEVDGEESKFVNSARISLWVKSIQ
jgi:TolB-like protein